MTMKNSTTISFVILVLLSFSSPPVYSQDPNAHLKIDPIIIQTICHSAKKPGINFFDKISDITAIEQDILIAEEYFDEEEIIKMMQTNPMKPYEIIRDAWNSKWSKCWCESDSYGSSGYVDIELLKSEQFQALRNIYDPTGKIRANINRIVTEHPYTDKEPMTLLDLIDILCENWGENGGALEARAKSIQRFSYTLKSYGAKKYIDLNSSAQKQQVKTTKGTFTDMRDGRTYKTVTLEDTQLGTGLTIMAENLNYKMEGAYLYNNDENLREKLGLLYTWEMAKKSCPSGWHLPSDEEWSHLIDMVGGESTGGKAMKATFNWADEGNGINTSGFTGFGGGRSHIESRRSDYGISLEGGKVSSVKLGERKRYFSNLLEYGYWWSSSLQETGAISINLYYYSDRVYKDKSYLDYYYSVRCVKD